MKPNQIPVLVLGFNRPHFIQLLFESLQSIKPRRIYFSVDGPRKSNIEDEKLVADVQNMVRKINWDCELHTFFRSENAGLKNAVISAIDWIFEKEEVAIILEDDCIPTEEFFTFCAEELERHLTDSRVMQISGNCYIPITQENANRYYFSSLNDIWGWATWKRSWELFEREIPNSDSPALKKKLINYFENREIVNWFTRYVAEAASTNSQVWSTQWTLTIINNGGLTVVPQKNLVRNIGFSADATHMTDKAFEVYEEFETGNILSTNLPTEVIANRKLDALRFLVIKKTDLNLRKRQIARRFVRQRVLNILPNRAVLSIRRFKRLLRKNVSR